MDPAFLFGDRPADVAMVREALARAGYTAEGLHEALGGGGPLGQDELLLGHRTRVDSPRNTLIRLFLVGTAVPVAAAEQALAPLPLSDWAGAGLVDVDGDQVTGALQLRPVELAGRPVIVAHDGQSRTSAPDHVMGVAPVSRTLVDMTVRVPVDRVFDLGTGSGVQALAASGHARQVVATDTNRRAVAMAGFTMALNGVANVTTRSGDWFDPVAGERFGLIVSNPPFVISPDARFDYRDSALPADEVCRRIVAAAPGHLEEGGWCQLVASWVHGDRPWAERLAGWFAGTGCDAWVIQRNLQPVDAYASTWIRHEQPDAEAASRTFGRWMGYYEQLGIEAIGFGLITMRRTTGRDPWLRVEELTHDVDAPCGDAIVAGFERFSWLVEEAADPRRLFEARFTVAGDTRLDQRRRWSPEGWVLEDARLRLSGGLRYSGSIDPELTALLTGCDGTNRLGDLVRDLAVSIGARPEELAPQVLPVVRDLVERGYLVPPRRRPEGSG